MSCGYMINALFYLGVGSNNTYMRMRNMVNIGINFTSRYLCLYFYMKTIACTY
jgi:hypothetical protein